MFGSYGVCFLKSQVSVWAIPPGSQITTIESALGLIFGTADAIPGSAALTPTAAAAFRNSRRLILVLISVSSLDVLKFRRTNQRPKQIPHHFLGRAIRFNILLPHLFLPFTRLPT